MTSDASSKPPEPPSRDVTEPNAPQGENIQLPLPNEKQSSDAHTIQQKPKRPLLSLWSWAVLALLALAVIGALYLRMRHVPPDDPDPRTELILVQLNDTYRLDAVRDGKRGGMARVAAYLRHLKTQNPGVPIIVLHAGDFIAPSLESDEKLFRGQQMIEALNFLHTIAPVYVTPGNHEFDNKDPAMLADAIERSQFNWVVSNLERSNASLLPLLRERMSERLLLPFGKLKVGIFALTLDSAHEGEDRNYAPIDGNYAAIAESEIEALERAGADLIIGLTHLDMPDDLQLAKLRREHQRFRWIAGGHEHYLQREAGWPGAALITKGDSNARTIWKVSVVTKRGQPELHEESVNIDESIKGDAAFERNVENFYRDKLRQERPYLDDVIAEQPKRCYDATEETVRERESNWGSFLADNMRKAYRNAADIAVLNGGSIRIDDTFCDKITFEHLERTFAFPSPVVFVKLKGKDIREQILESSAKSKKGDGSFLQVSGVSFRRVPDNEDGKILQDLKVQSGRAWADLRDDKTYVVAVPGYLFNCGNGYQFRKYVTEYIPPGPDLRTLTYSALTAPAKKQAVTAMRGRIITLPTYARPYAPTTGIWKPLSEAERECRQRTRLD